MNQHTLYQRPMPRTGGFTLVELLVSITIIAMLAGIVLSALASARETARIARTKSTITKIDSIIMAKYESYRTRRVPVDNAGSPKSTAQRRLWGLRELMVLEMPERWTDVSGYSPTYISSTDYPAVNRAYRRKYSAAGSPTGGNEPAECLYMIVSMADPDAMEQFNPGEIADTDENGLREFVDGWGKPIFFLRWAPGFFGSDVQTAVSKWDGTSAFTIDATLKTDAAKNDHDPFDYMGVDTSAWRLAPLIYSAGPDGEYGISYELTSGTYTWAKNTYTQNWGLPVADTAGEFRHYDNIHNHRLEANR